MDSIDPVLALVSLLPIVYLSAFAHEVGHAVMGRAAGLIVTSFGLGTGQPLVVFSLGGAKVFFCRQRPFQGLTFCFIPRLLAPRTQMIPFEAGGIIANSLVCVVGTCLWRWELWGRSVWFTAASLNGVFAIANLLPYQFRVGKATLRSDGNLILQSLRKRTIQLPAPVIIMSVKALRGLWESIGDYLILRANLLGATSAWVALGDFERAEIACAEVETLPPVDLPSYMARAAFIRSTIARGAGRIDEAVAALAVSEAHFRSVRDETGLVCVAIQRALTRLQSGDAASAVVDLENLVSHPLVRHNPALHDDLWVARLAAAAAVSDMVALEEMIARDKSAVRNRSSSTRDLFVYQAVARLYAQKENWLRAEPAYRRAIMAVNAVVSAWPDPAQQSRFLERQSAFLDEARHCFQVLNKSEEADRLIQPVLSVEELQKRLDDAPRLRHRRLLRAGLLILLINILCCAGLIVVGAVLSFEDRHPVQMIGFSFFVMGFSLASYTLIAVLYLLFHVAIGRLIPKLHYSGGAVILLLACMPWLSLVFIPLFLLFGPRH